MALCCLAVPCGTIQHGAINMHHVGPLSGVNKPYDALQAMHFATKSTLKLLVLEFEWSTKKWIGRSTQFYVHNFGPIRLTKALMHGHLQTPFSSRVFAKCMLQISYLAYCTTVM